MWKEVKPVCAELTVPLGARLNCEARERRLDARLWCTARRSIEGVRGGIVKVGVESSQFTPTSLSPIGHGVMDNGGVGLVYENDVHGT